MDLKVFVFFFFRSLLQICTHIMVLYSHRCLTTSKITAHHILLSNFSPSFPFLFFYTSPFPRFRTSVYKSFFLAFFFFFFVILYFFIKAISKNGKSNEKEMLSIRYQKEMRLVFTRLYNQSHQFSISNTNRFL